MNKVLYSFVIFLSCMLSYPFPLDADISPKIPSVIRLRVLQSRHLASIAVRCQDGRIFLPDSIGPMEGVFSVSSLNGVLLSDYHGEKITLPTVRIKGDRISISCDGKLDERVFEGAVDFYADHEELVIVNETRFESYVHTAALSEIGELLVKDGSGVKGWENELLKAMEICIRSYISANIKRHDDPRYSFCDLTHCVHFAGIPDNKLSLSENLIITDLHRIIKAYFHSSCGGTLSQPKVYWPDEQGKTFRSGSDRIDESDLCKNSPHTNWSAFIRDENLSSLFNFSIDDILVQTEEGRVCSIALKSKSDAKIIPIASFMSAAGKAFGWNTLKSNCFTVQKIGNGFRFDGHGLGHGTGLCQYGAMALAKKGWTASEILKFYYPGSVLAEGRSE